MIIAELEEELRKRVYARCEPDTNGGCLLWTGSQNDGYGNIGMYGKVYRVHRITFGFKESEGAMVLHKCDVRACCNPNHLFLGTAQDNAVDRARKGRTGAYRPYRNVSDDDLRYIAANPKQATRALARATGFNPETIRRVRAELKQKGVAS